MAQVALRQVTKVYPPDLAAVRGIDLVIEDGEFAVLVGPSGCGKSTLLRLIAGLETLSAGDLLIDGVLMNRVPPRDRDIGMVFQNNALYPHLTVRENLAFGLKWRNLEARHVQRRIHEAADMLGIEDLLQRMPQTLSGGERQRVAIGRAIVKQPRLLLLDEPLSNLDADYRVRMRLEIAKLHAHMKATLIYVTHDQIEAMTMADRIVVLDQGRVQQVDTPMHLYQAPAHRFVAGFIGSPPMNFLPGILTNAAGPVFRHRQFALPLPIAPRIPGNDGRAEVLLGIRPEHIALHEGADEAGDPAALQTRLLAVEPLGSETLLHLRLGTEDLTVRTRAHRAFQTGDTLQVRIDPKHALLFDAESGAALA